MTGRPDTPGPRTRTVAGWAWLLALPVLCCAGPGVLAVVSAGSLTAVFGGVTGGPVLLTAGAAVLAVAIVVLARRAPGSPVTPEQVAHLQHQVVIAAGTFPKRLAATGPGAQALYRALLPSFAATGAPPPLDDAAAGAGLTPDRARTALDELAAADLITLAADGTVAGAFPLSARPTRHRVQVQDGPVLHAMCAVDALGVPAMLGRLALVNQHRPDHRRAGPGHGHPGRPAGGRPAASRGTARPRRRRPAGQRLLLGHRLLRRARRRPAAPSTSPAPAAPC